MKNRRICLLTALLLAGAISGILAYNRTPRQLVAERNYIESRYGPILALIETRAAEPAVDWRPDIDGRLPEELADRESEIYSEIAQALPLQLVYWATWSSDGHHGLRGLDSQKGHKGYQTDPKPVTRSSDGLRELRCGQSVEGDELLVLRCRVPKGRKRVCDIAFYKSAIRQEMMSNTIKDVQQVVDGKPPAAPQPPR